MTRLKALIAWIEVPVRAVTYEPTGRWHRAFEEALLTAGLPLVRDPLQRPRPTGQDRRGGRAGAGADGRRGDLRPTEASSSVQRALEELRWRDALVKDRTLH